MTKKAKAFLFFSGLAGLWLAGLIWFYMDITAMTPPAVPEKADAIVVLTGGSNRLQTGFDLLEKDLAGKMYISGVYRGTDVKELLKLRPDAQLACCIEMGDAENTAGNAEETLAWLEENGFKSFYLVTAHYHIRRAGLEFNLRSKSVGLIPWPVKPSTVDIADWPEDAAVRSLIVKEYTKYILSLARAALTWNPS